MGFFICLTVRQSIQFSRSVVSYSLRPHGLQHTRPPCPSPTPRVYSNSRPLSWRCHPIISSSVVPFSCLQSFPASGEVPLLAREYLNPVGNTGTWLSVKKQINLKAESNMNYKLKSYTEGIVKSLQTNNFLYLGIQ